MKLTKEQIAIMAPSAAHIRVDGSMYQMDWCDPEIGALQYSDMDEGLEFAADFEDLSGYDIIFYELKEMVVPVALPTI